MSAATIGCPSGCGTCGDSIVCRCQNISEATVVDAIQNGDIRTFRDLRCDTGAGTGCMVCHRRLKLLLAKNAVMGSDASPERVLVAG